MCAIQIEPIIETARLQLRRPAIADAPRLAKLLNDADLARTTQAIPHPYGLEDAEGFLDQVSQADPQAKALFIIDHPAQGPIGAVGFDTAGGRTELGYWLGRPFWGCGFATEATTAALDWAHRTWKRRYVLARHFADNPASAGVLIKAGFLYTGEVQPSASAARRQTVPARMMVWLA